jgi:hypothetical protein
MIQARDLGLTRVGNIYHNLDHAELFEHETRKA